MQPSLGPRPACRQASYYERMSTSRVRVSVVMPVRNEAPILHKAVTSVLDQQCEEIELKVLVVDGDSDDGSSAILAGLAHEDSRLRVLRNPHRSIPHGLNIGLAEATGEYICIFGSHTTYDSDYVKICLQELRAHAVTGCGGRLQVVPADETSAAELVAWTLSSPFGSSRRSVRTVRAGYVDTVAYPVFARRPLLDAGGYNERLARNEDNDLNQRLRAAGHRFLMTGKVASYYRAPRNLDALLRHAFKMGYWNGITVYENRRAMSTRHFVPGGFVAVLGTTLVLSHPWSRRRAQKRASLAPVSPAVVLGLHLAAGILTTIRLARETRRLDVLQLPVYLLAFHVSYGAATIAGLAVGPIWRIRRHRR